MSDLKFLVVIWVPIFWMLALSSGSPPFLTSMVALTAFIIAAYWAGDRRPGRKP